MKTVKIFLASSIEDLKDDRVAVGNYFRQLNDIYIKKGIYFELVMCEDYDNAMSADGKQSQYDCEIEGSELCFFLFFRKAGEYTKHEFEIAMESFKDKAKPKIVTYFRDVSEGESISDEVKAFMSMLDGEFKHYYNTYGHIDTLKLGIIMQIKLLKLDSTEVKVEDGEVKLEGVTVAKSENVPILNGNETLRSLTERKRELQVRLDGCRKAYLAEPSEENEAAFFDVSRELNEVSSSLTKLEREVLDFMTTVAEMTSDGRVLTHRQKEALEYFNKGDYDTAQRILEDAERENELERAEMRAEAAKNEIRGYIEEDLLWIRAEKAKGVTKENIQAISGKFEKIFELTERYSIDRWVLFDYAAFLYDQKHYTRAIAVGEVVKEYYDTHSLDSPKKARLFNILAMMYSSTQRYADSEKHYIESSKLFLELCEKSPELYMQGVAMCYNNLGLLYFNVKRHEEAEKYYLMAIEIREELSRSADCIEIELAQSYNNLGLLYTNTQRYKDAEKYYLDAIRIREKWYELDPLVNESPLSTSYNNIGLMYFETQRYGEAERYYLIAAEMMERLSIRNPDAFSTDLAYAYHNLGLLCANTQRQTESEKYYLSAVRIFTDLCHDDPDAFEPQLAQSCNNLGFLYYEMHRAGESEKYLIKAIAISERLCLDNPHAFEPLLADNYNNIALLYFYSQRFEESEEYYLKAIGITERLSQKDPHAFEPRLATVHNNVAVFYRSLSRYDDAKSHCFKALEIYSKLVKNNPEAYEAGLASCYNNLGIIFDTTCMYEDAVKYCLKALELRERMAKGSPEAFEDDLAQSYSNLAVSYTNLSSFDMAEKYLLKAIEINERLSRKDSEALEPALSQSYNDIAYLYSVTNRPEEAEKYHIKAIEIRERLCKRNPLAHDGELFNSYNNLAIVYNNTNRFDMAEKYYLKALEIIERLLEVTHGVYDSSLIKCCNNLGLLYSNMQCPDKAERYFLRGIKVAEEQETSTPDVESDLASMLSNLANLYSESNKALAEEYYQRSVDIYLKLCNTFGNAFESELASCYWNMGIFCENNNMPKKALECYTNAREIFLRLEAQNPGMYSDDIQTLEQWIEEIRERSAKKGFFAKLFGK